MAEDKKTDDKQTFYSQVSTKEKVRVENLQDEWGHCDDSLSDVRNMWEDHEKLFYNKEAGDLGDETSRSKVNDAHLSTAIIQRTQRIMAQPPTGKVEVLDSTNQGKGQLLSLVLDKYVKPNANAQYSHLTKLKLWTIMSQVYGSAPVLVQYRADDDYVGPDFRIIPVRQYYPQPGTHQTNEMGYCFVDSFVTMDWLLQRQKKTWKHIDKLYKQLKDTEGVTRDSYDHQSYAEKEWGGNQWGGEGRFANVLLRTKYMRDRWVTYAPDFQDVGVLRDIENPHKDNQLPIVVKETIPQLDRSFGIGDVERGAPAQKAYNSVLNLALDSAKFSLYPPMVVNRDGVVPSSMKWEPGAMWFETMPNSIRELQLSPQRLNTFGNLSGTLISTLNNMLGTTDLSTYHDRVGPSMGKTPQALRMQAVKESAADSWERQSLEVALEELYNKFVNLLAKSTPKPIDFGIMRGEIQNIAKVYPDVEEMFEGNADTEYGKLTIKPEQLEGEYKFYIDSGSSRVQDEAVQNKALTSIMQIILKQPAVIQAMRERGKDIDMGELTKRWLLTSGIDSVDKIIVDAAQQEQQQGQPQGPQGQGQPQRPQRPNVDPGQFQDPRVQQMAQELFGGGGGGMPMPRQ